MEKGALYICPTPIGNLEDITLRTLKVLEEVDIIAAEDTRHTIKLLNHYNIKKPLTSYHEHNKREKGVELIEKLNMGETIALVSDAGMPGISDPGEELIALAIEEDIRVIALPGPTASVTALILSGLPTGKFVFEGFLPSKKRDRIRELEKLKKEERTFILYESPHRLLDLLKSILDVLGNRKVSISRELTKVYEETFRGTILEAIERFESQGVKGEFVLIIEGGKIEEEPILDITIEDHIRKYIEEGLTKKDAIKKVAEERNLPKNRVYKESLKI
ncbi:16S rRNA (cytidine(1402)-2'-O)-methyltransferase [Tissierella sp. MSJ-40]|uniref:Ribosomal RNA small subunit methyltransferase I n=1 Tax=Tissierella simiarum TaxID=2841534 RepID=A0ABS6E2C6_9FIRM|nr:16S rRNA (cytidine(1402)-2'-O)-methyltransferase [Tissierella simiarum]MBU5437054.1 16S rRNA (cytidine(1402)-2'-O)-methyltransferase [Tissierella simiarum]